MNNRCPISKDHLALLSLWIIGKDLRRIMLAFDAQKDLYNNVICEEKDQC